MAATPAHPAPGAAPAPGALPADQPVVPLLHSRWQVRDGAPPNITAMAQTLDGWLWIASSTGLFRFDGVSFSPFQPAGGARLPVNIQFIGTLPDGRLWIAPQFGGIHLVEGEQLRSFGAAEGLPVGIIQGVAAGADGRLWLATGKGLYALDQGDGQWRDVGVSVGAPGGFYDIHADRAGTVWIQGNRGTFALRKGESRFAFVAPRALPGSITEGPDGTVWTTDEGVRGLRRLTPGKPADDLDRLLRGIDIQRQVFIDSRGSFWIPVASGVLRVAMDGGGPRLQGFTARQGLSGQQGRVVFEDREGSIWIATDSGLDQFRHGRMQEIVLPRYMEDARPLVAGPDGDVWIDYSYLRTTASPPEAFGHTEHVLQSTSQLYRDPHGTVWVGGYDMLARLDGLKRIPVPLPDEIRKLQGQPVYAIVMDADDGLWISLGPRGPWRLKDGTWTPHGGIEALKLYPATTIVAGPGRALWFGSVANHMAILQDGHVRHIGAAEGLDIGTVLQIVPDADGAWLGGDDGLARFDGKRVHRIQGHGGEVFSVSTGLVLAPDGTLWANTARGVAGIAPAELKRALADPGYRVRYRRYDANDGLFGAPAAMLPLPSMVRTASGELVISTTGSVYRFDPASATGNRLPPPVHVTGIGAAGATHAPGDAVRLPAAPGTVRIDYTALSLAVPHRVRFQTMLEGVDAGWQDAGERRSAFYTRLDPGKYTFRVKAANDDGVWNKQGAALRFDIPPTMTQTLWFKVLCALALALATFGVHRLRLRMALRRQSRVFEARVAERERIARDLHDTLLQSVQGLIMHFRRIALRTPDDAPTRPMMQEALSLATEVLEEGRDKVGELRETPDGDLAALLEAHGRRLAAQNGTAFSVAQEGAPRRLQPPVHDEVLAIAREAVRNAFLHAQAANIGVTLHYGERDFTLAVRDDGIGIDGEGRDGRAGHWGIPGMRERAAELGATLELDSAPGGGSTWRLQLPARLAYARDGERDAGHAQASHEGELQ